MLKYLELYWTDSYIKLDIMCVALFLQLSALLVCCYTTWTWEMLPTFQDQSAQVDEFLCALYFEKEAGADRSTGPTLSSNPSPCPFQNIMLYIDRLCGLVVRVLGYRSGGPGSIPGTAKKK
jgi:hypothetical protein